MSQDLFAAARLGDLETLRSHREQLLAEFEAYPYHLWAAALETDQVEVLRLCLEAGLDPDGTVEMRPLIQAAGYQARKCIDCLLAAGADPTLLDENGRHLLQIAVGHGDVDLAKIALEHGANPFDENIGFFLPAAAASVKKLIQDARKQLKLKFAKHIAAIKAMKTLEPLPALTADEIVQPIPSEKGTTLLHLAAKQNLAQVIRDFVTAGANVDVQDQTFHERKYGRGTTLELSMVFGGRTPLMVAAEAGAIEATQALLELGADVHRTDSHGETALHLACRAPKRGVVRALLDAGANPNAPTQEGGTPLLITGYFGSAEVAQMLLDAGAKVDQPDEDGFTPILAACWEGRTEVAEVLLAAGAKLNATTDEEGDVWDALHIERRTKTLKRLLPHLDLNPANRPESPLATAAQYGHVEAIPMMITAGARPKSGERIAITDTWNMNATAKAEALKALQSLGQQVSDDDLIRAVWQDDAELIRSLVTMGANPGAGLHDAREPKTVDLLIELGAEVDHLNAQGRTALQIATERAEVKIVGRLLKHGADPRRADLDGIRPVDLAMLGDADLRACFKGVDPSGRHVATLRLMQMFNDYDPPTLALVEEALKQGGDPNVRVGRGFAIVALAAARRLWAVAERLIAAGAEPTWETDVFMRVRDLPIQAGEAFESNIALVEAEVGESRLLVDGGYGAVTFRLQAQVEARQAERLAAGENATAAGMNAGFETAPLVAESLRPKLTSCWCGSWRGHPVANPQLLLVPTTDPYTVVALIQPHAGEHDIGVFEILRFLREHEDLGWSLIGIGYDTVDLEFARLPSDVNGFAAELYEFCPDLIDQGFESLDRLEESLRTTRRVHLWWD